ncbi:MAG: CRISPR-associated endonuclease Cas2 [Chloroflexi bacterium]|nr:CRISPR-associated endonuclease Cas2 [Chloroflexota bacterium]
MNLLIYDISDDRLRLKVANICLDYGLMRIQRSAFAGTIPTHLRRDIMLEIRRALGDEEADVRLYTLCERDAALTRTHVTRGASLAAV